MVFEGNLSRTISMDAGRCYFFSIRRALFCILSVLLIIIPFIFNTLAGHYLSSKTGANYSKFSPAHP